MSDISIKALLFFIVVSSLVTQSKVLIGYRSSLIAYCVQCAVGITAMFFCITDEMYCCLNITVSGLRYIVYLIRVLSVLHRV